MLGFFRGVFLSTLVVIFAVESFALNPFIGAVSQRSVERVQALQELGLDINLVENGISALDVAYRKFGRRSTIYREMRRLGAKRAHELGHSEPSVQELFEEMPRNPLAVMFGAASIPVGLVDPFGLLPNEVMFRLLSFLDPIARLALWAVSSRLHEAVSCFWACKNGGTEDSLFEVRRLTRRGDLHFKRAGNLLYFVNAPGTLHVLDINQGFQTVAQLLLGAFAQPPSLIEGLVYCSVPGLAKVLVLDPAQNHEVITTVETQRWPRSPYAFGENIYVLNAEGSTITKFRKGSSDSRHIEVGRRPRSGCQVGDKFYLILDQEDIVLFWDPQEKEPSVRIDAGSGPSELLPYKGRLYVAHHVLDKITVIDPAQNVVVRNIEVGKQPDEIRVINGRLFVLDWEPLEPLCSRHLQVTIVDLESEAKTVLKTGNEHSFPAAHGRHLLLREGLSVLCTTQDFDLEHSTRLPFYVGEMLSHGPYLFARYPAGHRLMVYDSDLKLIKEIPLPEGLRAEIKAIGIVGRFLLVQDHQNNLRIFFIGKLLPLA